MFRSKVNLVLLFAITLILPNYSKTAEICEKNTQNSTDKENQFLNQFIYDKLLKEEIDLTKEMNIFLTKNKLTPMGKLSKELEEFKLKNMKQSKERIIFFKKICIDIVKNDIKKGALYTIALGLKIGSNDQITMELLPLNNETKIIHNRLLFALKLNPENKQALQELQKLNADRINKAESKSAESLFPKIVMALQTNPASGAEYSNANNTIYIHERSWLSTNYLHKLIHEFIHRLQHLASNELGGVYAGPLDKEKYDDLNNMIAIEIEACRKSIEFHPDLPLLLEWLAPQVKPFDQKQNDQLFPYYSPACEYVVAYKQCLKNNINLSDKLKEIYKTAHEHYKKRKKREIYLNDWEDCKVPSKNLPNYLPLIKQDFSIQIQALLKLASETVGNKKPTQDVGQHILDTVDKAKKGIFGCKKYFELKEKFGLNPK